MIVLRHVVFLRDFMISKGRVVIASSSTKNLNYRDIAASYQLKIRKEWAKTTAPADSHLLTNGNTRGALDSLTLEIERDPVLSIRYGRS